MRLRLLLCMCRFGSPAQKTVMNNAVTMPYYVRMCQSGLDSCIDNVLCGIDCGHAESDWSDFMFEFEAVNSMRFHLSS
jgi:hypothetical protein